MTVFFTIAYNSEKTLSRAIGSIISQSNTDWVYYILDNGSSDYTYGLINEFAMKDRRIIPLKNHTNKKFQLIHYLPIILSKHDSNGFFAMLDADDEYSPGFLEEMLGFVTENQLDVAVCGTDWISEETHEILKHKVIEKNITLEGGDFAEKFPACRNFMVTVWAALFSFDLLKKCSFAWAKNATNFADTAFCMEAFRRAGRAGILAESLHKYYIAPTTVSFRYNPDWFKACKYLHKISREYLLDYGPVSRENENYLCVLYLILIKYILPRIQNSDVGLSLKLTNILEIFTDKKTRQLLRHWSEAGIYSDRKDFIDEIKKWIAEQESGLTHQPIINDILTAMDLSGEETK
jgi:glycosyltransferase involved in cell wall biosynthesis